MNKIIVYWSSTGNTEEIANNISQDLNIKAYKVNEIEVDKVLENDIIILGCPAMGSEELEEYEFRPFFDSLMKKIGNQKIALFGSYGWGDGEWMRNWEGEVGKNLLTNGLISNGGMSDIDNDQYQKFIELLK